MRRLAILGSTGSVGVNALRIAESFPERFKVVALAAGRNDALLAEQVRRIAPEAVSVLDDEVAAALEKRLGPTRVKIMAGVEGATRVATWGDPDLLLSAFVGASGLVPTLAAIRAGINVALANKEVLVMAGELVMAEAQRRGVRLLPVDSEHAAIHQCLAGQRREDVRRVCLTASGGPFRTTPREALAGMKPADALRHPNWDMGPKITVDSASLMNKGLEMIEARWLFDLDPGLIDVVIHPQSIVHSLVEFVDGSVIAQLGVPDMRGPIAYAIGLPERLPLAMERLDLAKVGTLSFERPDHGKFPNLGLAVRAMTDGGTMPAVLNAANEAAVKAFLEGAIPFTGITETIARTLEAHAPRPLKDLDAALGADAWARDHAMKIIRSLPIPE
ncbi:MAG: 1-deoxy-D-xylulose-5-phosphate reductoisomerase [Myxococcota bacterium]